MLSGLSWHFGIVVWCQYGARSASTSWLVVSLRVAWDDYWNAISHRAKLSVGRFDCRNRLGYLCNVSVVSFKLAFVGKTSKCNSIFEIYGVCLYPNRIWLLSSLAAMLSSSMWPLGDGAVIFKKKKMHEFGPTWVPNLAARNQGLWHVCVCGGTHACMHACCSDWHSLARCQHT